MSTAPTFEEIESHFVRLRDVLSRQDAQCRAVDSWIRPELAQGFEVPPRASRMHRSLADLSRTPWLRLVVDNVVQAMFVDDIRSEDQETARYLWQTWMENDLTSRQIANHRAMVSYGHSYGVVSRAEKGARIRFVSPRRLAACFSDFGNLPYPDRALEFVGSSKRGRQEFSLHYPGVRVDFEVSDGGKIDRATVNTTSTGLDYVPVVRFSNQLDLDGRVIGEVEPFIPAAQRINKTAYDRLLAQHFNSWKVKWATGLDLPEVEGYEEGSPEKSEAQKRENEDFQLKLSQEDMLVGENPETKFGTLDATALDPFVNSWRADIEALAAASQTPAHALTGQLVNLSAEALAAARAPLTQKVYERQTGAGVAYSRMLRIAAQIDGNEEAARDATVRAHWQDMEIRSMSQALDALGKAATMLQVPVRGLWGMIPQIERTDVREWERLADEESRRDPVFKNLAQHLERHQLTEEDLPEVDEDRG